jgi:hypothetical protein
MAIATRLRKRKKGDHLRQAGIFLKPQFKCHQSFTSSPKSPSQYQKLILAVGFDPIYKPGSKK